MACQIQFNGHLFSRSNPTKYYKHKIAKYKNLSQNNLLDRTTSEMINSLTSSGGYYNTEHITHKSFIISGSNI